MAPTLAIIIVLSYFGLLWLISFITSRNAGKETFFTADKGSNWILVAFGMIGVALSGLTFISVPGEVGNSQFTYFQMVMGYTTGVFVIAFVLLPLYYKLKLVSIYSYLNQRFGKLSHKTGAIFFLISQTMTAAFKLFLMTTVLQLAFFDAFGIPFEVSVFVTLMLIWLYTYRAGIKTIVITDTLQTAFLIIAAVSTIIVISNQLDFSFGELFTKMQQDPKSKIFDWDWASERNFFKLFFTGMFLTIITNGLDQSIMQKHLTCPTIKDAKKNMFWFGSSLLVVNVIFLALGLLLYIYASHHGIETPQQTDELYPLLALKYLGPFTGAVFLIGIAAAAYSSADSALAGLTTSFCIDLMGMGKNGKTISTKRRTLIHLGFAMLIFLVIVVFHSMNNDSLINSFIKVAGYTYGPLLGLFAFGMFSKRKAIDAIVPYIAVLSPVISVLLYFFSERMFGFKFGFEILLVNGALTIIGLWISSLKIFHKK
ncbi:MAG: sodium:solute symporter [Bacteroidota bacterium]